MPNIIAAHVHASKGELELELGNLAASQAEFQSAVDLLEGSSATAELGRALHNLAIVTRRRGELDRARELYLRALAIKVGDLDGPKDADVSQAQSIDGLGLVELAAGNPSDAIEWFRRSLHIYRSTCDPLSELTLDACTNLVEAIRAAGQFPRAYVVASRLLRELPLDRIAATTSGPTRDLVALANLFEAASDAAAGFSMSSEQSWREQAKLFRLRSEVRLACN
jgi:tetratricopeptide (TPR) repeat protein